MCCLARKQLYLAQLRVCTQSVRIKTHAITNTAFQAAEMTSSIKLLEANGHKFAVSDQGDERATPVVLLHGFPNNKNMWSKQVSLQLVITFPDVSGLSQA